MTDSENQLRALYSELRAAEAELERWRASEHEGIIAQCERRVQAAKTALLKETGTTR